MPSAPSKALADEGDRHYPFGAVTVKRSGVGITFACKCGAILLTGRERTVTVQELRELHAEHARQRVRAAAAAAQENS